MLATLTSKELEMLRSISQDDLAPPPSQEDIFGQIDAVKKQFEEDHELIARQFEENKVSFEIIFLPSGPALTIFLRCEWKQTSKKSWLSADAGGPGITWRRRNWPSWEGKRIEKM